MTLFQLLVAYGLGIITGIGLVDMYINYIEDEYAEYEHKEGE